jgi:hypothetical protein
VPAIGEGCDAGKRRSVRRVADPGRPPPEASVRPPAAQCRHSIRPRRRFSSTSTRPRSLSSLSRMESADEFNEFVMNKLIDPSSSDDEDDLFFVPRI